MASPSAGTFSFGTYLGRFRAIVIAGTVLCGTSVPAFAAPGGDALNFGGANGALKSIPSTVGAHGMVVSAQHLASDIGARILKDGGNAIDAAVAVGYALAVVYPAAGNIGGGGFMTLRTPDGKAFFVDFREHAPLAATETMYQDANGNVIKDLSTLGWKSVAVPGTVAGLDMVLKRWGTMSREKVMAPAIALARDGYVLEENDVHLLNTSTAAFASDPYASKIFLRNDGQPFQIGDRFVQSDLARTLQMIADQGPDAFYKGWIAQETVRASKVGGGILEMADFAAYKPRVLEPVHCIYRGFHVDTAPPPSGGGVALCEMLNILSGYDLHQEGLYSPKAAHQEIEAMRHTYSDRRDLGDPAFVQNPVEHLVDPAYAARIRAGIPADRAVPSSDLTAGDPQPEKHETTHYSIMDKSGYAVAVTYTLNGWFGGKVMAGRAGYFLNDEMDDFATKPGAPNMFGIVGSKANAIAPGKTPLSSMSPTILSYRNKAIMAVGSPGGSRIPTITLAAILGVVDYGKTIQDAVDMPRIHEQWEPETVEVEPGALSPDTIMALEAQGYQIAVHQAWGSVEGVLYGGARLGQKPDGKFYGGYDRRHAGGGAAGE
ncbi:gamma-glutamyltransferase [Brytella acorum]|uniref:Glutathione hydrolase proenzyme n=1 Tax=Brytella acorum TaxID=2959299 RepID=A0AA35VCC5_9PROT|nr:gamma-glutamyltransferase [Brytella acorum]MDF3625861.1 gamma-glutamyltransferase [Brytella acorum]CAI9121584.1 gamma-glutamyltransferase [Brytella acorum]